MLYLRLWKLPRSRKLATGQDLLPVFTVHISEPQYLVANEANIATRGCLGVAGSLLRSSIQSLKYNILPVFWLIGQKIAI